MGATFIFCADPLRPRRPDEHYADEAAAVRDLGHPVALIDHDALTAGRTAAAVARVPEGAGPAWYRGWMLTAGQYAALSEALAARGVSLSTAPEDYRRAHELPGWYPAFAPVTPPAVWLPTPPGTPPAAPRLATAATTLGGGPAIVKDYVKSRKDRWDEACFVPDLADPHRLAAVVARFVELQDASLTGGVVIRAFEDFRTTDGEARLWWIDGDPALLTAHPDSPALRPRPDPAFVALVRPLVAALGCRFVTTDLARRADGAWRVVEVGDGQVSDLPKGVAAGRLVHPLATALPPRAV
ncbi:ATP-grasp domain-containing protein [Streptomyces sp. NPDC016309]|uniref:ATP-grasp domain-containing protein n=1 Tax=Streptomyces sp. NPDC016309 TaxID=3364965 RepID=UPI0036F90B2D